LTRRSKALAALAIAAVLAVTACGGGGDGADDRTTVTLLSWDGEEVMTPVRIVKKDTCRSLFTYRVGDYTSSLRNEKGSLASDGE
jgi:hypothetical protein